MMGHNPSTNNKLLKKCPIKNILKSNPYMPVWPQRPHLEWKSFVSNLIQTLY